MELFWGFELSLKIVTFLNLLKDNFTLSLVESRCNIFLVMRKKLVLICLKFEILRLAQYDVVICYFSPREKLESENLFERCGCGKIRMQKLPEMDSNHR